METKETVSTFLPLTLHDVRIGKKGKGQKGNTIAVSVVGKPVYDEDDETRIVAKSFDYEHVNRIHGDELMTTLLSLVKNNEDCARLIDFHLKRKAYAAQSQTTLLRERLVREAVCSAKQAPFMAMNIVTMMKANEVLPEGSKISIEQAISILRKTIAR